MLNDMTIYLTLIFQKNQKFHHCLLVLHILVQHFYISCSTFPCLLYKCTYIQFIIVKYNTTILTFGISTNLSSLVLLLFDIAFAVAAATTIVEPPTFPSHHLQVSDLHPPQQGVPNTTKPLPSLPMPSKVLESLHFCYQKVNLPSIYSTMQKSIIRHSMCPYTPLQLYCTNHSFTNIVPTCQLLALPRQ